MEEQACMFASGSQFRINVKVRKMQSIAQQRQEFQQQFYLVCVKWSWEKCIYSSLQVYKQKLTEEGPSGDWYNELKMGYLSLSAKILIQYICVLFGAIFWQEKHYS